MQGLLVLCLFQCGLSKPLVYSSYNTLVNDKSSGWETLEASSPGGDLTRHIEMKQKHLPVLKRMYIVHVPDAYTKIEDPNNHKKFPVLWYFHGQGMNPGLSIQETDYANVADHNDYFVVFPKGVGGAQDGGAEGTGWNVGTSGDNSTCTRETWSEYGCACSSCYASCETLGYCSGRNASKKNNCGWSTCYDDVAFTQVQVMLGIFSFD